MGNFILDQDKKYFKKDYLLEKDLTRTFEMNYKKIISQKSFFIPIEKGVKSRNFKNSKYDGIVLVWENPSTPLIYITEIELERHNVYTHVLPQLGDFISFIKRETNNDLSLIRKNLYNILDKEKLLKQIRFDTEIEAHALIERAMEDLQILLVIDNINPILSSGLSIIEKAISVKIRKIEVSRFETIDGAEAIFYTDSDSEEIKLDQISDSKDLSVDNELKNQKQIDEYSLDYHLKDKSAIIKEIVNNFIEQTSDTIEAIATKHYISFIKNDKMVMSAVPRLKTVVFYSKKVVDESDLLYSKLNFRDVRTIGHLTNHLPTEIIVKDNKQLDQLIDYFNKNF